MIAKLLIDEETRRILMVYCDDCRGKGLTGSFPKKSCKTCDGKGHIQGHPLEGATIVPQKGWAPDHVLKLGV